MAGSDHHIETRDHGRGYSQIRMWLRTVLLSSLLVLSHEIVSRLAAVGEWAQPDHDIDGDLADAVLQVHHTHQKH